jgi:hypothetical protein
MFWRALRLLVLILLLIQPTFITFLNSPSRWISYLLLIICHIIISYNTTLMSHTITSKVIKMGNPKHSAWAPTSLCISGLFVKRDVARHSWCCGGRGATACGPKCRCILPEGGCIEDPFDNFPERVLHAYSRLCRCLDKESALTIGKCLAFYGWNLSWIFLTTKLAWEDDHMG